MWSLLEKQMYGHFTISVPKEEFKEKIWSERAE